MIFFKGQGRSSLVVVQKTPQCDRVRVGKFKVSVRSFKQLEGGILKNQICDLKLALKKGPKFKLKHDLSGGKENFFRYRKVFKYG